MRQMLSSDKTKKQLVEEDLIAEGNYVKQKTREIREQLIRAQAEARKQLSSLTVLSNKATKKLEATITKVRLTNQSPGPTSSASSVFYKSTLFLAALQGERVLRVAEMYHKLENEQRSITSALFLADEPDASGSETPGRTQVRFQSSFLHCRESKSKHSVGTQLGRCRGPTLINFLKQKTHQKSLV